MIRHFLNQLGVRQLRLAAEKVKQHNDYEAVPGKLGLLNDIIRYPHKYYSSYEKNRMSSRVLLPKITETDVEEYMEYIILLCHSVS